MALTRFACLLSLLAIVASAAGADPDEGPTYDQWKDRKGNETAAADAAIAKQKKMSAVDKVVELMTSLQQKVLEEGESEAQTYNKFSCFCKDTSREKVAAIDKGEDEKASLTANINTMTSDRAKVDAQIKQLMEDIAAAEKAMAEASATRAATLKTYETNAADLKAALEALDGALSALKSSKAPGLLQLQGVTQTLRSAILLADALGLGAGAKALALLQAVPQVPTEDYKFHSANIISTLETLKKDFWDEKNTVDADEVKSVAAFDTFMQEKSNLVKAKNRELDEAQEEKSRLMDEISMANQQLTTVAATLLDDQEYLKKLSSMCSDKAKTWDQRTKVRQEELFTLTQAIGIIKGAVTEKTTAATIRFAQQGMSLRLARAVASDATAMEAVEAEAEAADEAPAFLQSGSRRLRSAVLLQRRVAAAAPDDAVGRKKVADLLRSQGQRLHSALLTSLAGRISGSADPFAKVKTLIQELIERLLQEQGNEANQKAWCDKSTSAAEQKRTYAAEEIENLNAEMASLEAIRDKLAEELTVLGEEIKELKINRAKAEQLRAEEKAENENTILEAQQGKDALESAIKLLSRFYKTVAKESVDLSLAQKKGPADDAPDAGFKIGEAYKGGQSESGGILGMMDVMKSDFSRTISETEEAEAQAEQDHLVFMTETGKSLAQKEQSESERITQKDDAEDKLSQADESLQSQTVILQTSITELLELKPVCVDTGMSYEERVERRRDEIEALKKALCVLGNYATYGPEGAADSC
mmetsp:Transcript_33302/g.75392  ORF Transcript_33302/g.75392 Transcript_33302/m.75392 type:complete len:761 (+) Transcript_33302:87-2369(+)